MSVVPQSELHRHLDVSLRASTFYELAQSLELVPQSTSLSSFQKQIFLKEPLSDLKEVLAKFELCQKVLDRPESLERLAFEAAEDCWNEGTRYVEFRYSPGFITEFNSMSWEDVLDALEHGLKRASESYPDLETHLIVIASRDYGPESAYQTAEFFLKHRSRLVGFDLAGNEVGFPSRLFEQALAPLKKSDANITVHAGEACGPENVWESIELLGAKRIGHGVRSLEDPQLMDYLVDQKICLEVCPTSNWLTRIVDCIEDHPLPTLLRAGISACINTDDPGIFDVTLPGEVEVAQAKLGMSEEEIRRCFQNAYSARFGK